MRYVLPFLFVVSATPVLAQTVDTSGAEALTSTIQRYIGTTAFEKGAVRISADGDAYKLEVDFGRLIGLFPKQDKVTISIAPYALRLKPRPDATWDVAGDMTPDGSVTIKAPEDSRTMEWRLDDDRFSGVFDPALANFSTASGSHGRLSFTDTEPKQSSEFAAASGTFEMKAAKNATAGIDFTMLQTMSEMTQTIRVIEGGMDMPVVLRAPEFTVSATGTGYRTQALLDLLAFAVANAGADEAKLKGAQSQLKTLLREALPLWEHVAGVYGYRDLSVGTPMGIFSAASAKLDVSMDGVRKDGTIAYKLLIDDLAMPTDALPKWTLPLLPEDIHLNLGGAGLDLEGPATMAIDALDLSKDPPVDKAVGDAIVAGFMANPPKFVLDRSVVRNKDTEISAAGEMTFAGGKPTFTATVEAAGFEKAMETLQQASATAPEAQQAFMAAAAAKGFAKTLADGRLQWVIDMTADGAVTVNGTMVKGPDGAAPQ